MRLGRWIGIFSCLIVSIVPASAAGDVDLALVLVTDVSRSIDDSEYALEKDGYAAAWGDPPILLRCGVPKPRGLDKFATCQVVNGVGWFIPEDQSQGDRVDITMTTVGRSQNVEVFLPSDYFPPANAMVDLASAIKRTIREDKPCL